MSIKLDSATREYGKEQPGIKLGMFTIRLPIIHVPWETPEMLQALVVFVTGVSATAFLEDIFGLPFAVALSIVVFHEFLYLIQNIIGDPLVGGWITPAVPIITTWLLSYGDTLDRTYALIALQLVLGLMFLFFGLTGLARRFVDWVPNSVKAGILIGSSIAAVIGRYGFMPVEDGGIGFFNTPVTFSIGVLLALFLLFSDKFKLLRESGNNIINFISKSGFVSALLIAYLIGMIIGEVSTPVINLSDGIIFNPINGLIYTLQNFSLFGLGLPPINILIQSIPTAIMVYIIAFSDIIGGTAFIDDVSTERPDELLEVNPNLTNIACGIRNTIQSFVAPTVTMSGPLWSAMMVTIAERYKTGQENMYSLFGGAITFNLVKLMAAMILPLVFLVQPVFPLAMSLTLMIQAFAGFYVGMNMTDTNLEKGVAGVIGGVLAVTNPLVGLTIALVLALGLQGYNFKQDTLSNSNDNPNKNEKTFEDLKKEI